jgi:pilus assembly protein Flp/PilA
VTDLRTHLRSLLADRAGAAAIEYGLIASLIAVAILGAVTALGVGTAGMWTNIGQSL